MSNELQISTKTFDPIAPKMQEAGFDPTRVRQEISFAVQAINKSPQLQKCSQMSLMQAVMNVSNIGLTLNPAAKESYLIPRWNNVTKQNEAALEPSYIGLVKLLTDAGSVSSILCQLVYENDQIEINIADNQNPVKHKPELVKSKRGNMIGAYALATLVNGNRQVEWMDKDELMGIRDRSETFKAYREGKIKSCTWVTDEGEMCRKTVAKRITKYLPRTERMEYVDKAIQVDNSDFTASNDQLSYIESLLHTSTLEDYQRTAIEDEFTLMSSLRASEVIKMLQANQQETDKQRLKRLQSQE